MISQSECRDLILPYFRKTFGRADYLQPHMKRRLMVNERSLTRLS